MKARELKEIIKVIDCGIFRFQEFIDREEIINPQVKRDLARGKRYIERAIEEVRRY